MEDIGTAIMHAVEAGKLRTYVRKNGGGLAGLVRLADRHSAATTAALNEMFRSDAPAAPAVRFHVRSRPGEV
jgi:hypothetical protein